MKDVYYMWLETQNLYIHYTQKHDTEQDEKLREYWYKRLTSILATKKQLESIIVRGCLVSYEFDPECDCEMCGALRD